MNEADIPIDIHTLKLQDWLISRRLVPKNIQKPLKDIREKISRALQDMPEHERLRKLLIGTNINYYHCKEIVEILKQTEKDTKSVFGTYGSQRMKDWQEVVKLYEKESVYLAEAAQLYVRNVNFEIPGMRKQMTKLEQQSDECIKRSQDLNKPETQFQAEHAALLQQLGVKGENLREEFIAVLGKLPELYKQSISNIGTLHEAIELYADCSIQSDQDKMHCLPILRHLAEYGNTTIYQYIHKEAPLSIEEPIIKLNLTIEKNSSDNGNSGDNNEIDFGDDDNDNGGGTSSTVSAELIDFGGDGSDLIELPTAADGAAEIDWGIETTTGNDNDSNNDAANVEINFDIPIEEYGIVVERVGMDGGTARGEQAYTLLDSPQYRDRFLDELYELESFLRLRLYEMKHMDAGNLMYSLLDSISTQDESSIQKMLSNVGIILQSSQTEQTHHLFQLKHSPKYADLLASKLKQMSKAVEKIRATREALKLRAADLKEQRQALNPVLTELIAQTKQLQSYIEADISKRYKNRPVNLLGGV